MNRSLILIGLCCILVGLLWPWLRNFPLGRLPGDIVVVRENFRLYFPLTSCVVISLLLTILFWLFRK
jgi:hypothetical protein